MTVSTVCAEHNMGEPGQHYQNCTACSHPMTVHPVRLPKWSSHAHGFCLLCRLELKNPGYLARRARTLAKQFNDPAPTDPDLERLERIQQHSNMQQSWLTGTET